MIDIRFRHQWPLLATIFATLALALAARYAVMEPKPLLQHCALATSDFICQIRTGLPQIFLFNRLGLASLVCGVLAFALRSRHVAWPGLVTGLAGLVLYNFDYSAAGFLLSLLVLTRPLASQPHLASN